MYVYGNVDELIFSHKINTEERININNDDDDDFTQLEIDDAAIYKTNPIE